MNPKKIKSPAFIFKLISSTYFYYTLAVIFIANLAYFLYQQQLPADSFPNTAILYPFLVITFIIHEVSLSFSIKGSENGLKKREPGSHYIFPVFYVNLEEISKLNKFKRIIVNLSAIYFQLVIGLLLIAFSFIFNNPITENLFKLNFIIILINLNPFITFDGYWILSDLLHQTNLNKKANEIIRNMLYFKKVNAAFALQLYAFLKILLYCWAIYSIGDFAIERFQSIMKHEKLEFIDCFSLSVVFFILFNMRQNLKRK